MSRFHWGWRIGLVYAAFALSTLGFVAFAMTQRVDLVRDDYYQESLRTTAAQQELINGREAGVVLRVEDALLHIRINDASKHATSVLVDLYRPDDPSLDQHHAVSAGVDRDFTLSLAGMPSGRWKVTMRWTVNGQVHAYEQSIMVQ